MPTLPSANHIWYADKPSDPIVPSIPSAPAGPVKSDVVNVEPSVYVIVKVPSPLSRVLSIPLPSAPSDPMIPSAPLKLSMKSCSVPVFPKSNHT